jgi:AraC-like DNA-binding protein
MSDARLEPLNTVPRRRVIAEGQGWTVAEYLCCAGPGDPPFEERHERFAVVAVAEGTFRYRTDAGEALLHPGAVMLANAASCYECGHEHGVGDRCVSVHYAPTLFEEIATSVAGSSRTRFTAAMLPALSGLAPATVAVERLAAAPVEPAPTEELALVFAERTLAALAAAPPRCRLHWADARRVSAVLRHVEAEATSRVTLADMAALAGLSSYHFLRTFRRVTGSTPYRYLLELRLRRAATCLVETCEPVSAIAFDAGFGDLSTFNGQFRRAFGMTPTAYREKHSRRRP